MTLAYTLKTAPTFDVVTTEEAKAQCHVTHSYEDALFTTWISAARQWVESFTGRALARQTWQLSTPYLCREIPLPYAAPLGAVTFVKYYDSNNTLQTWSAANYLTPAFREPAVIEVVDSATWPSTYLRSDAIQVEYTAGYATAGDVPAPLRQAVLLLVSHWNEQRETILVGSLSKEIEFTVTALCKSYMVWVPR